MVLQLAEIACKGVVSCSKRGMILVAGRLFNEPRLQE